MPQCKPFPDRRTFLKATAAVTAGITGLTLLPETAWSDDADINIIGPKAGFSPQIGTLVSMLAWMRMVVLSSVKDMPQKDLDYLFDSNANTIGALLLHLAATETYYQMNTFDAKKWGSWPDSVKQKWDVPMSLGEPARKIIKGNNLDYYLNIRTKPARDRWRNFTSATTAGYCRLTKNGRGDPPTTTASGSTSANTNRTTTDRSSS